MCTLCSVYAVKLGLCSVYAVKLPLFDVHWTVYKYELNSRLPPQFYGPHCTQKCERPKKCFWLICFISVGSEDGWRKWTSTQYFRSCVEPSLRCRFKRIQRDWTEGGAGLKYGSKNWFLTKCAIKERGVAEPPLTPHFKIRTTGFEEWYGQFSESYNKITILKFSSNI